MDSIKNDSFQMAEDVKEFLNKNYPASSCGEYINFCSYLVYETACAVAELMHEDPENVVNLILRGAIELEMLNDDNKS